MKPWLLSLVGIVLVPPGVWAGADNPPAAKILELADQYRAGWESFALTVKITNYKKERIEDESRYEVFSRKTKSFVRFLSPRDKGRSLLMLDDDMWIYIPSTSRPIRISPLQKLTGNVSNGDVARTNYAGDYQPKLLGEERVEGQDCYLLELKAIRKGATYPRIQYWITKADFRPRRAEFYLTSGKNHKSAYYDSFQEYHGKRLLARMTIYDRIRRDEKSVMEYLRYAPEQIADKYFNKNSMATN
jgi:outer membrane lipoprotein-sorting protein